MLNLSPSSNGTLGAGFESTGTLRIADGMQVTSAAGYLGYRGGSNGTATVTGVGSKWTNNGQTVRWQQRWRHSNIEAGGEVVNSYSYVSGQSGTVNVNGAGSKWTNTSNLTIGVNGSGRLNILAGGEVSSPGGSVQDGTVTVTGTDSRWNVRDSLSINDTLHIEAGGQVSDSIGGVGGYGEVTVIGTNSKWITSGTLNVGSSGTLNIGSDGNNGGLVKAAYVTLALGSDANAFCNLKNGGIFTVIAIIKGIGYAYFNWYDGTIQNYDPLTDLTVYGGNDLILKLAATGTHAFNIDSDRLGTVTAILTNLSSGGSLKKTGAGTLTLTAVNTYNGGTTIEEGRLKVTGSILNTSGVSIGPAGILELAKVSGSATAASVTITNAGTVLVSAGMETVG